MKQYIWLRMGDNAEYEIIGSIVDLADWLIEIGVTKEFVRYDMYGITDRGKFKNYNYISLYYGDDNAQPIRPISDKELTELNNKIREKINENS